MENYKKQFTKPEHQNWLKLSIALMITKRGLAPFACKICDDIRVKSLNKRIKHFFPDLCTNCSIVEIIPCDPNNNICNSGQCRFHKGRSFRPCLIVKCNDYRNTVTDLIRKGLDIEIICNSCRTAEIVPCNPGNRVCNLIRCKFHMDQNTRQFIPTRPCPQHICDTLRETIGQKHRFGSPSWRNTDARKWCVNAWEIAKCFMPPDGYADVDNEVDTDFNGIITVYINCVEFQQYFTDDLSRQRNICCKVRDIGKRVRHAPGLNISDWDLKFWLSDLKTLFADPTFNKNNPLAQDAIDQLDMLERDELLIQHSDIAEVLDIKNTFEELSSGLEKRASDIGDVVDDIIAPVKHDATDRAIQDTRELIEWKQDAMLTKGPSYIIRFAVQVIEEEALQLFTKEGFLLCLMNDKTESVWLLGYLQHGRPRAQIKYRSLLGKTFEHKLGNVSQSNCKEWQSFDVPQNILDAEMKIHQLGKKNFAQRDQADVNEQAITKSENPEFLADINPTEGFEVKAVQSETGTMTEFMKKAFGNMTELRDETSLADSMNCNLLEPSVNVDDTSPAGSMKTDLSKPSVDVGKNETGTMTEFMKKDFGNMTEHRDETSLADSMNCNLLEPRVNVDDTSPAGSMRTDLSKPSVDVGKNETGTMTEFMKKDFGNMTELRDETSLADSMNCNLLEPSVNVDDTSPAGSMRTDLSKPSVDVGKNAMADIHINTVEEALAKEPDSIINLAVQVIKTEASQSYTNSDNIIRSYFPCLVADETGSVWLRVYQEHERNTFKSHTSIMLRGLLRKSCEHPMWCVSTTELICLKPVDVPQKIIEAAMKTTQPMSPQIRFLDEAVTSQSPSIAVDKLLPRDAIHEVTDPIPDSPDPDLLADVDGSDDICNTIKSDHTSPADSLETVLSEPSVNFDIEARTISDLMKKCIGTITENREQLEDQNETDEPLAAIKETLFTQTQLNELCSQDGRKSETVSRACNVIVNHLKETFDNMLCSNNVVLDIYPAFKVGKENEIIFVVTLSKTTDISFLCNAVTYTVEIRVLHKFNNELKTLMDAVHEESHSISDECQRPIAVTIGNWAKPLLEAHKYLSVITASPLKSKRNKDSEILQSFVREPECCIVFCVHAKDFIYIKEDPLPAKLNGISTDVMEGAFVTFGRLSHESHDKLPMGCEIGRGESRDIGTLGGFIDHPEYGLCGITSGHMCLDHAEYEACVKNNGRLMLEQWPKGSRGRGMFQPAKLQNGDEVGQLVEALYQVGSHLESGFDVALFQIENKYPEDGNFPAEKINDNMRDVGYTFKGGNVCGLSRAAGKSLWKFGRTSGSTTGKANLKTPTAVQEASFNWKTHDKYHITLVNQFEVSPIDIGQNKIFATHGDSGALVFIDEDRDDLKCVGMVAGGLAGTSIAIISPISSILKHCNVTKFHSFYNTPRQNSEAIQNLERRLGERIETMHSQLDQRITRIDDNFKRLFIMLEQQSNCASNTSSHEKRPSTQEINKSSKK